MSISGPEYSGDAMNDENVGGGRVFDLVFEAGRGQGLDQLGIPDAKLEEEQNQEKNEKKDTKTG